MKYYSKEHQWAEIADQTATVGITKHAADELGDITFVELPEIGDEFEQGEEMFVIESVKAASDVFSPLSGKVTAVNEDLVDSPETVNDSPEANGWFCKLEEIDEAELDNLMSYSEYCGYIDVLREGGEEDEVDDDEKEE
ncbi:MAG: glycine cleavage system protein GcvH [Candidatus Hydrothermarchaeaceae archaeon]